jgi:queuine tRNA-ribosyltransferase
MELKSLLNWMMPLFNTPERRNKCRHLLGIADIESIHNAVQAGCDTMDSSYPTKLARHGTLMTRMVYYVSNVVYMPHRMA